MRLNGEYDDRLVQEEDCGAISEHDAALLVGLVLAIRPRVIAEVGTGWFRSIGAFHEGAMALKAMTGQDVEIWSCDIRSSVVEKAIASFPAAHVVCGTSQDMLRAMASLQPELIFIDGDHEIPGVKVDVEVMLRSATDDAVLVFHDTQCRRDSCGKVCSALGGVCLRTGRGIGIVTARKARLILENGQWPTL